MPHLIAKVDVPTFSFYEPESYDNRCFDAWLQCADNVVVRSEEQKKALSEKIRQRAIVIPPSVDSGIKVGYKQVLDEFTFFVPNGKYNAPLLDSAEFDLLHDTVKKIRCDLNNTLTVNNFRAIATTDQDDNENL